MFKVVLITRAFVMEPKWLEWAKSLSAIAQNGLTYSENKFDIERFKQIREIAAQMMSENSEGDLEFIKDLFENAEGYQTPKVDVRSAVFKDNKILLVKEKTDGGWTLPGGWADPNELPSEAAEREVFEESGFKVKAEKVLAVYDRTKQGHYPPFPFHIYKLFFLCGLTGGSKKTSIETEDVEFFSEENIPSLSASRTTTAQIHRCFEHYHNQSLQTDFD
jgi:ADP-ribose pyrophosphatase YjhB (NUDIX family)